MKTPHKGFIAPILLILVAIFLVGGGAYVYVQNKQADQSAIVGEKTTQETSRTQQQSYTITEQKETGGKGGEVATSIADFNVGEKIKSLTVSGLDISNFKSDGWFSVVFSGKITLSGTYQTISSMGESPDGDVCFEVSNEDFSKLPAIKEVTSKQSFCFQNASLAKEMLQGNGIATIIIDDLTYGIVPKGGWRPNARLISVLEKKVFTTAQTSGAQPTSDQAPHIDSLSQSSGPIGTTVVLYGSFPMDTRITFDGYIVGKTTQNMSSFPLLIPSSISPGDPSSGAGSPGQIILVKPGQHSISSWNLSSVGNGNTVSFTVTSP